MDHAEILDQGSHAYARLGAGLAAAADHLTGPGLDLTRRALTRAAHAATDLAILAATARDLAGPDQAAALAARLAGTLTAAAIVDGAYSADLAADQRAACYTHGDTGCEGACPGRRAAAGRI